MSPNFFPGVILLRSVNSKKSVRVRSGIYTECRSMSNWFWDRFHWFESSEHWADWEFIFCIELSNIHERYVQHLLLLSLDYQLSLSTYLSYFLPSKTIFYGFVHNSLFWTSTEYTIFGAHMTCTCKCYISRTKFLTALKFIFWRLGPIIEYMDLIIVAPLI